MSQDTALDKSLWPQTCHGRWMSAEYEPGLVSVIIPTYNRAHFLVEVMDSVWAQTYRPIELIVVDDGSTDNTREVVEEWGQKCASAGGFELHYFHQENKGASVARNLGLIKSRGEFIQFLDSDDLLGNGKIMAQANTLASLGSNAAVYGASRMFREHSGCYEVHAGHAPENDDPLCEWLRRGFTRPHTILWRRSDVLAQGPWDESLAADQDGEYGMRFLVRGGRLAYCPSAWAYYRSHSSQEGRLSRSNSPASLASRIRVTERVEQMLASRGKLTSGYRNALAQRYYKIARRAAVVEPALAHSCLQAMHRVLPSHGLTKGLLYSRLARIIGLPRAEALFRRFRFRLGFRRRSQSPSYVPSASALCGFEGSSVGRKFQ